MRDFCFLAFCRIVKFVNFILNIMWANSLQLMIYSLMFLLGKDYRQMMYGESMKVAHFTLDTDTTTVNHGSYGAVPKKVQKIQKKFQCAMEQSPDVWFRYKLQPLWEQALKTVAEFVGAKFENIVFVPNSTCGVNTVLRSLNFSEATAILVTNQTFGAVYMTAREVCQAKKAKLLVLNITYPTADFQGTAEFYVDDVVTHYSKVLQEYTGIKLAVIDYITSSSALLLPVSELVSLCHKHNVAVLIDGAHAPGQVPLNLEELGADFFLGNLHKWAFAPRGCAILWINPKYHDVIDPLVVSWNHGGSLHDRFFQQGTLDYTSFVSAQAAIEFYHDIGGMDKIRSYNERLVSWASSKLAADWNTEVLPVPVSMRAPFMSCIRLPDAISTFYGATNSGAAKAAKDIFTIYGVIVAIVCIQSSLWCRISAQIYNAREDYLELADAVRVWKKYVLTNRLPEGSSLKSDRHSSWFSRSSILSESISD